MKTIFLILLFTSINLAQTDLLLLMNNDTGFNPLTYDSKNIALYDGDLELTVDVWNDQANSYDLTLNNDPTIVSGALNGHQAVRFNGTDEDAARAVDLTDFPNTYPRTMYLVVKVITWGDYLFSSTGAILTSYMAVSSPRIYMDNGSFLLLNPELPVGDYGVLTYVFNGANSEFRLNDNTAVTGNDGGNTSVNFYLASVTSTAAFANIEVAYLIIRSGADNTATQDLFITYLKNRFSL